MFGIPENWLMAIAVLLAGSPLAYYSPQIIAFLRAVGSKVKGSTLAADPLSTPTGEEQKPDEDAKDAEAAKRLQARQSKRGKLARETMQTALQHYFDPIETPPETPVDPVIAAQVDKVLAARSV